MPSQRERARCSGCDKRRVVAAWFGPIGGIVRGRIYPVCRECLAAGELLADGWTPVRAALLELLASEPATDEKEGAK